jgi:hypothetical protein
LSVVLEEEAESGSMSGHGGGLPSREIGAHHQADGLVEMARSRRESHRFRPPLLCSC